MKKLNLIIGLLFFAQFTLIGQSDNCVTATSINLNNGSACVSGTTANATSSNTLYGACNATSVNEVWYTYVSDGSQNDFSVIPIGMQDAQIVVYTGGCNGVLELCDVASGGNTLNTNWGIPAGTQVWIGIMSNNGIEGSFDFCVDSYPPPAGGGNACGGAIPVCSGVTTVDMNPMSSSGVFPSCFGGAVNQDVWFTFDVLSSGTFEWSATPSGVSTGVELDWALYDITGGCPGTEIDCNYNYDFGSNNPNGQTPGGTGEFNPPSNLTAGNTYAIVVDFFSSGSTGTLDFSVDGGTAQIAPNADFSISPVGPTCGPSVNVSITDNSVGAPDWDFGDGTTYTGNNPPDHLYSTPGTYAITASFGGACPSVHTEFVELYGPVVVAPNSTDETCPGDCDGTADVQPSGGSGNYSYSWSPGGQTTPSITGVCAGTHTVTVTDDICGAAAPVDVNIDSGVCPCNLDNFTANISACDPATSSYTTTGTVEFTFPPTTGQLIIEDCNGNQDVYNAPFTSPVNYTITGQNPDGAPCDVSAYFTDDASCSQTINYNAPFCPCNVDAFNANIGLCDQATNTYMMSGDVSFTSPPSTGNLVVEVNNGTNTYDTIINLPATSPQTWSISGIPSDGSASDITVYFTSDPGCSSTISYTAPTSCACDADLGTFSTSTTGGTPNDSVLCYGDAISITSNNDWTGPGEMFNPPGPTYDPGVSWLIYSCPPTVGLTPQAGVDITTDPCFLGLVSDNDLNDINDLAWINSFPPGTFTDNIIYWVPITMYSQVDGTYSYVNGTIPCYELGAPYPVQYLPEFTSSFTEDCMTGQAVITVNGGLPAIDGSSFTVSNLQPSTASFSNTTAIDGGTITITGLQGGDNWSFDISDGNGCPYTVSGGPFPPLEDPGFNYPQTSWCTSEASMAPTITGVTGGTFTSTPAGLSLNASTGEITPGTSTPGTYDVTYTTPGTCFDDSTITVNIAATPSVDPVADQTVCEGTDFAFIDFTGSAGSTFDWTNDNTNIGLGASGTGDINVFTGTTPSGIQEVATVTVTPSAGSCVGTAETFILTVNPQEDPGFNYAQNAWCTTDASMTPNITGVTGGSFSSTPAGLSLNGTTGEITPGTSTAGTYDVTYTSPGPNCPNDSTITIDIHQTPVVDPILDQTVCAGDNFDGTQMQFTGPYAGTTFDWTNDNTNIGLGASGTGNISSFAGIAPSGVQEVATITVTPSNANCTGTAETFTLTVNPLDDPSWNYPNGLTYCQTGTDPVTNVSGLTGGSFSYTLVSNGPNLSLNTTDGTVDLDASDEGTYDITYSTAGLCPQDSTLTLNITNSPIPDFLFDDYCLNDSDPLPTFINNGTGGVFSSTPAGLSIDNSTGQIDLSASSPGVYTITNFIGGASTGCADTSHDETVEIYELPNATIVGDATICPGDNVPNIGVNITGNPGPWVIEYTVNGSPNTLNTSSTTDSIITTQIGTYETQLITDQNTGCEFVLSDQVVIDTFPDPILTTPVDQDVCEGEVLMINDFTATPTGTTFEWDNTTGTDLGFGLSGTGNIGSFTGINGTGSPLTVTVQVTPTSANGCVGTPKDFEVTVHPLPEVSFTGPAAGCEPLMVTFNNTTLQAGQSCIWDFGDGNTAAGCGSVTHTFYEGIYDISLTVTTAAGCVDSASESEFVDVTPVPEASFTYSPQEIDVQDTEVEFINNSINASTFEWDFGDDSPIMTTENPSHTYPIQPESYTVTLWAWSENGMCYDSTQQVITIKDILIYYVPNVFTPDGDEFNEEFKPVFYSGYDPFDYHLTIFNRWGEVIFESYNAKKGWNGHYGDGGLVQDGVYVWQIEFKESMSDKRHTVRGHVTVLK